MKIRTTVKGGFAIHLDMEREMFNKELKRKGITIEEYVEKSRELAEEGLHNEFDFTNDELIEGATFAVDYMEAKVIVKEVK